MGPRKSKENRYNVLLLGMVDTLDYLEEDFATLNRDVQRLIENQKNLMKHHDDMRMKVATIEGMLKGKVQVNVTSDTNVTGAEKVENQTNVNTKSDGK